MDVDTEQVVFDCVKSNLKKKKTLEQLISGGSGGQKSKEDTRWNLKSFWNRFSTKKPVDELYSFECLTSHDNETSDESDDDGELTIGTVAPYDPEKDASSNRIININHLRKAIEDNTVCKKCSRQKEIDIMRNVVDEFSKKIKATMNINIPNDIILEFKKDWISDHQQAPTMEIQEEHLGIATTLHFKCRYHVKHCCTIKPKPSCFHGTKQVGKRSTAKRLTWYALNNQLVLSQLQNGCGPKEAASTLGFLDLPRALSIGNKGFNAIEMEVGQIICAFGEQAMDEALLEEIKLTLEHEMKEWNLSPLPRKKNDYLQRVHLSPHGKEAPYNPHGLF